MLPAIYKYSEINLLSRTTDLFLDVFIFPRICAQKAKSTPQAPTEKKPLLSSLLESIAEKKIKSHREINTGLDTLLNDISRGCFVFTDLEKHLKLLRESIYWVTRSNRVYAKLDYLDNAVLKTELKRSLELLYLFEAELKVEYFKNKTISRSKHEKYFGFLSVFKNALPHHTD